MLPKVYTVALVLSVALLVAVKTDELQPGHGTKLSSGNQGQLGGNHIEVEERILDIFDKKDKDEKEDKGKDDKKEKEEKKEDHIDKDEHKGKKKDCKSGHGKGGHGRGGHGHYRGRY